MALCHTPPTRQERHSSAGTKVPQLPADVSVSSRVGVLYLGAYTAQQTPKVAPQARG